MLRELRSRIDEGIAVLDTSNGASRIGFPLQDHNATSGLRVPMKDSMQAGVRKHQPVFLYKGFRVILGLHWDNGKEMESTVILGLYRGFRYP